MTDGLVHVSRNCGVPGFLIEGTTTVFWIIMLSGIDELVYLHKCIPKLMECVYVRSGVSGHVWQISKLE